MHRHAATILTVLLGLWLVLFAGCSSDVQEDLRKQPAGTEQPRVKITLIFNGGPTGGTFNYFANKMSNLMAENVSWLDMLPKGSGGSLDNICALNTDQADMAIVYAGDAFLGRNGRLDCEDARLDHVRALAYLYGAPAQLVVRRDSGIDSVHDLKGKVVAVGNKGSGAALAAERFFKHIDLWGGIDHRFLGYSQAAADFASGKADAFWVLVGYPNASVIEAATQAPIRLLDLHEIGVSTGFYDIYPFYNRVEIPAGTYEGQTNPVITFQDSALWCAREHLDEDAVYSGLKAIFNETGLADMRKAHKAARSMSIQQALDNLSIPLHPGAARFWVEQGLDIPTILLP